MSFSSKLRVPAAAALLAVAACGSAGSSGSAASAAPSWVKALGAGVTVTAGNAPPGDGSPGASLLSTLASADAGDVAKFCSYFPPSDQASCNLAYAGMSAAALKTAMPTDKKVVVTYTAIDGDEALVDVTGTVCNTGEAPGCTSNSDPAALLDSGKPFATLWAECVASTSGYTPFVMTKVNGKWYNYQGD